VFDCVFVFLDLVSFDVDVEKVVDFVSFVVVVAVVADVLFAVLAKAEESVFVDGTVGVEFV
jgi:hypothetical protein